MAAPSLKDRFLTPPVARAIMSPLGIVLAGVGASAGILLGLPAVVAAGIGALAWAGRVAVAVPRAPTRDHIDAFALSEPWRTFVADAQQSRRRYDNSVSRAKSGPLRTRLVEIGSRLDDAVRECWRIACAGDAMADALGQIGMPRVQRELDALAREGDGHPEADSPAAGTAAALRAQLATGDRLTKTIEDARARLRLLDARLDETVARAIELSVSADESELESLSADVDGIVGDMEALRAGIVEADVASDRAQGELPGPQEQPGTA